MNVEIVIIAVDNSGTLLNILSSVTLFCSVVVEITMIERERERDTDVVLFWKVSSLNLIYSASRCSCR